VAAATSSRLVDESRDREGRREYNRGHGRRRQVPPGEIVPDGKPLEQSLAESRELRRRAAELEGRVEAFGRRIVDRDAGRDPPSPPKI
jgi:hypothetical protein